MMLLIPELTVQTRLTHRTTALREGWTRKLEMQKRKEDRNRKTEDVLKYVEKIKYLLCLRIKLVQIFSLDKMVCNLTCKH